MQEVGQNTLESLQTQGGSLATWSKGQQKALLLSSNFMSKLKLEINRTSQGDPAGYLDPAAVISYYGTHRADRADLEEEEFYDNTPLEIVHKETHCFLPLRYIDGYPSTPWGVPYWERLDGEPIEYFDLFRAYRESTYLGQLKGNNPHTALKTARSIYALAERSNIDRQTLLIVAVLYHWHDRARAYDKYNLWQLEQRKLAEQVYMENEHAAAARRIFKNSLNYLESNLDQLNPKTALEWFQAAVQLERLSLGMDPTKPPQSDDEVQRQDRRSWVQVNVNQGQGTNLNGTPGNDGVEVLAGDETQGGGGNGDFATASSKNKKQDTQLERLELILKTLQQAKAIDITPDERGDN